FGAPLDGGRVGGPPSEQSYHGSGRDDEAGRSQSHADDGEAARGPGVGLRRGRCFRGLTRAPRHVIPQGNLVRELEGLHGLYIVEAAWPGFEFLIDRLALDIAR